MKNTLLLTLFLLVFQVQMKAQNTPLNKQQTLDYIETLYKQVYSFSNASISKVSLLGKILTINFSDNIFVRKDLSSSLPLEVIKEEVDAKYMVDFTPTVGNTPPVFVHIQLESDAKRLKKALEHLIEILKQEKNTDPFGE